MCPPHAKHLGPSLKTDENARDDTIWPLAVFQINIFPSKVFPVESSSLSSCEKARLVTSWSCSDSLWIAFLPLKSQITTSEFSPRYPDAIRCPLFETDTQVIWSSWAVRKCWLWGSERSRTTMLLPAIKMYSFKSGCRWTESTIDPLNPIEWSSSTCFPEVRLYCPRAPSATLGYSGAAIYAWVFGNSATADCISLIIIQIQKSTLGVLGFWGCVVVWSCVLCVV